MLKPLNCSIYLGMGSTDLDETWHGFAFSQSESYSRIVFSTFTSPRSWTAAILNNNSLGDEIANVNCFYDDILLVGLHIEASAYAH